MNAQEQNKTAQKVEQTKTTRKTRHSLKAPLIVLGCVLLLVLSPWVVYLNFYEANGTPETDLDFDHSIREVVDNIRNWLISNTTTLIQQNPTYNSNIKELRNALRDNLEIILSKQFQPYFVPEHSIQISVEYSNVKLTPMYSSTVDLDRYPKIYSGENNKMEIFTTGRYFNTVVPYSFQVQAELSLTAFQLKDDNSNGKDTDIVRRIISIDEIMPTPHLFIEYKLQQLQSQTSSAFSDVSRLMKFMLTTMARMRMYKIVEFGNQYTYKNLINEGDVELCLNLAILLEEAVLFRAYDTKSLNAIDTYFYHASNGVFNTNPTGKRQWGSAEIQNYEEYLRRRALTSDQDSRLLSSIISKYVTSGYIDATDLIGLYLVLDKGSKAAVIDSPKDTVSILQERYDTKYLMDPQTLGDDSDSTNLKFIHTLPEENDKDFTFNFGEADKPQTRSIGFHVDQQPNYQVLGADFKVTGLDDPRAWYTTAKLREGTRTGLERGSRTQSVVPEPPPDHDYRLEWEIWIEGDFELRVKSSDDAINPWVNQLWVEKVIHLNFPVNIFVWSYNDPKIGALDFTDFNLLKNVTGGWAITSEAHLVQYFETNFWKYLKPFASLGFDEVYAILSFVLANQGLGYFDAQEKKYLNTLIHGRNVITSNWISDLLLLQTKYLKKILAQNLETFWIKFDIFMADYFLDYLGQYNEEYGFYDFTSKPQFPHPPLVPWLSVLGYNISLFYNFQTNMLEITFEHTAGNIKIQIEGYNTTAQQLSITLKNHIHLPGLINLTTTVSSTDSSSSNNLLKPGIFADGKLFDKYDLTTRTYSIPAELLSGGPGSTETNEQLIFTRAKFGTLYHFTTLELPQVSIAPEKRDLGINIELIVPTEHQDKVTELTSELQELIATESKIETTKESDEFLEDRIYLTQLFSELSKKLQAWSQSQTTYPGLAIDISISSEQFQDFNNITIFLTDLESTTNFLSWLEHYGLNIILVMNNHDTFIQDLSHILTKYNPYLTLNDLEMIDFEIYNSVLDHELQHGMDINDNIQDLIFQSQEVSRGSLRLLLALTGEYMINLVYGIDDLANEKSITLNQIFYTYHITENNISREHILMGTNLIS